MKLKISLMVFFLISTLLIRPVGAETKYKVVVYNPFDRIWSGPISVRPALDVTGPVSVEVSDEKGAKFPAQADDLNFDGKIDEIVFEAELGPKEIKTFAYRFSKDEKVTPSPFTSEGILSLKSAKFELLLNKDGLINSLYLLRNGEKLQTIHSANFYVWRGGNVGWEQRQAKMTIKRKIGPLRTIYYIEGFLKGQQTGKDKMFLSEVMKVYPNARIDNVIRLTYKGRKPVSIGNRFTGDGGVRATFVCDIQKFYKFFTWTFGDEFSTGEMKHAGEHMRGIGASGIFGGFMAPPEDYGILSVPKLHKSDLRLWDNRVDPITNTPKGNALIVDGLGWWGENIKPGRILNSGWKTYAFYNLNEAKEAARNLTNEPFVFSSYKEALEKTSALAGLELYSRLSKEINLGEMKKKYQEARAFVDGGIHQEKDWKQYAALLDECDSGFWPLLDNIANELKKNIRENSHLAVNAALMAIGEYGIYKKAALLSRETSDWEQFTSDREKAVEAILRAKSLYRTAKESGIERLVPEGESTLSLGFFGGDPSPLSETIWTAIASRFGFRDFHPSYFQFSWPERTELSPGYKKYPQDFIDLHRKYDSKYVLLVAMPYRKVSNNYQGRYKDWVWQDYKGKPIRTFAGVWLSPVSPELYGKEPLWIANSRRQTEALLKLYVKTFKENNIPLKKVILGFAVENEPLFVYDYNPHVIKAYHHWLKIKFQTVENLNKSLETSFKSFTAVNPPSPAEKFSRPAEWIQFNLFRLDNQAGYIKWQADIVKKIMPDFPVFVKPNASYGTAAAIGRGLDPWKLGEDQMGITGINDYFRLSDLTSLYTHLDMVRSGGNHQPMWLTEFGRGGIFPSGSEFIPPERVKEISYSLILHGVRKIFIYNLFSGDWWGPAAQLKGDLMPKEDFLRLAEIQSEFNRLGPIGNYRTKPRVAIYYSRLSTIMSNPDPKEETTAVHKLFRDLNYLVDYIDSEQIERGDLKRYKMLFIQQSPWLESGIREPIKDFVKKGGIVVLEGKSGIFNEYAERYKNYPADLTDLFGAKIIPNKKKLGFSFGDERIKVSVGEKSFHLKAPECYLQPISAKVLIRTGRGKIVATSNSYGRGRAILLAFNLGESYRDIVKSLSKVKGVLKAEFDKVGGIKYEAGKEYEEIAAVPTLGRWFFSTLEEAGLYPEVSRWDPDIEAAFLYGKSKKYLLVINHRNEEVNTRLELDLDSSSVREKETYYDVFTLKKLVARKIGDKSVIWLKLKPYQVCLLGGTK